MEQHYIEDISIASDKWTSLQHHTLFNFKRSLHKNLIAYLEKKIGPDIYDFPSIAKCQVNFIRDNPNISKSGKIILKELEAREVKDDD